MTEAKRRDRSDYVWAAKVAAIPFAGVVVLTGGASALGHGPQPLPPNTQECQTIEKTTVGGSEFVLAGVMIRATADEILSPLEARVRAEEYVRENGCGETADGYFADPAVSCSYSSDHEVAIPEYELLCTAPALRR